MKHARTDYDRIQDPAGKIPADEPVFLLRAQDQTAADTVEYWIRQNKKLLKTAKKTLTPLELMGRKKALILAEAHVYRMKEWTPQKPADA